MNKHRRRRELLDLYRLVRRNKYMPSARRTAKLAHIQASIVTIDRQLHGERDYDNH